MGEYRDWGIAVEPNINMNADNKKEEQRANTKSLRILGLVCGAVLISTSLTQGAISTSVDIGINKSYNGTAPQSSTTPWVDTLFQDIAPNTVQVTITAPNLTGPEFLQSLYLNYNSTKQVTALRFTPVFSQWHGLATAYSLVETTPPSLQASTGGNYDILLGFQTSGGLPSEFNQGDQVVFDITTTQANTSLSSLDFAFKSVPGSAGSFYSAALIQDTGKNNKQSDYAGATTFTFISVPEPASGWAAAGLCLAALGLRKGKSSLVGLLLG
jgi:hypothetical protein